MWDQYCRSFADVLVPSPQGDCSSSRWRPLVSSMLTAHVYEEVQQRKSSERRISSRLSSSTEDFFYLFFSLKFNMPRFMFDLIN